MPNRALIRSRLGHDAYLAARPFTVFGAVRVTQHVEFTHCIDAQQLLAGSSRLHVIFRRAGVLDSVQQKKVLLRPISRHREIVSGGGIRYSDASGLLRGEVDDARVQREQQIVTPPVERKVFHLLLSDQSRDVLGGDGHDGRVPGHLHFFAYRSHPQGQINSRILPDHQPNSRSDCFRKSISSSPGPRTVLAEEQTTDIFPPGP